MGIADEYDEQMRIVKDILLNTKFDNSKYILSKVKTLRSNIKTQFTSDPLSILILRGTARFDESTNFQNYISGLDYYNFLIQIEKKLSTNPKAVVKELKGIKKLILNKTNMVTIFAGNSNNIKKYKDKIKIVTDALPKNTISRQDYSKLPKPALREGIAIDSTVQYNIASADYQKLGTNFNGKLLPMQALIEQNYITPKIRFGYGAYAGFVSFSQYGFLIVSYRDPNIKQTFEVYKGLPNYIKNINITQKSLDRFILNAYSSYTAPIGELTGAKNALHHFLAGEKAEDELKVLREIKSTTVQDVKDSFSIFNNFIKNGSYSTAGNTQKLNENKELYDDIISIQ
jgi:Zn-dependent M16 (insulinase) family peptidase